LPAYSTPLDLALGAFLALIEQKFVSIENMIAKIVQKVELTMDFIMQAIEESWIGIAIRER
jgi:hypothetical protein